MDARVDAAVPPEQQVLKLEIGRLHACVLLGNQTAKCWGAGYANGSGSGLDIGDEPGEMGAGLAPLPFGQGVRDISVAGESACALLEDGRVTCWGYNRKGELGLGHTNATDGIAVPVGFVDLGSEPVVGLTSGKCATMLSGRVRCWGGNDLGVLGAGNRAAVGDGPGEMGDATPVVDVGAPIRKLAVDRSSGLTACAILEAGVLKCWGDNGDGKLGLGDELPRGDEPNEMGANLPAVRVGSNLTVRDVAVGVQHVCVILDNGAVKCWGAVSGLGYPTARPIGIAPTDMGDMLASVDLGSGRTAVEIGVGVRHSCALLDDGTIKCWGEGGRLGVGDMLPRGTTPGTMGDALPPLDFNGRKALHLYVGTFASCALLQDNSVACWGDNVTGLLGQERSRAMGVAIGDEPNEMGTHLTPTRLW